MILKVNIFFFAINEKGERWEFYPGQTLNRDEAAVRGLSAEALDARLLAGELEETEAPEAPAAHDGLGAIESLMAMHQDGLAEQGDDAAMKDEAPGRPEEE